MNEELTTVHMGALNTIGISSTTSHVEGCIRRRPKLPRPFTENVILSIAFNVDNKIKKHDIRAGIQL